MTNLIQKHKKIKTSICEKAPLTQALKHIEMEMQQQSKEPELAGTPLVSHVPVSVGSESSSSSSTLCSYSWKEDLENGAIMSMSATTHFRSLTESIQTNEPETIPTGIDSQGLAKTEEIRTNPKTSNTTFIKNDVSANSSAANLESKSAPLPSMITTRPAKKARTISNDSSDPAHFTTNQSSSAVSPKAALPSSQQHHSSPLLLSQHEDEEHLGPLHVFVRKQIEIFTATATELTQPAPGRKKPIRLHQVGLRCIHCHNLSSNGTKKARVKRAVCYPSSIARIYHSVSDMKFDHFTHCKEIPSEVRKTFEALRAGEKFTKKQSKSGTSSKGNSSSSTAKYYRDSASRMGLVDGSGGIIYNNAAHARNTQHRPSNHDLVSTAVTPPNVPRQLLETPSVVRHSLQKQHQQEEEYRKILIQQQSLIAVNTAAVASILFPPNQMSRIVTPKSNKENIHLDLNPLTTTMNSGILQSLLINAVAAGANAQRSIDNAIARANQEQQTDSQHSQYNPLKRPHKSSSYTHATAPASATSFEGSCPAGKIIVPLATPGDAKALNPLHCFVRKHLELFSTDKDDIEAPCPGRKTKLILGQVGIRCKHCAKLNLKQRVKRAVCYPPSIDGIYHSVSNMKFDHFGICPGLPSEAKKELASLRTSYSGRNISGTNTAQYYRDSAVAKGLVNTDKGIRFNDTRSTLVIATKMIPQQQNVAPSAFPAPSVSVIPPALVRKDSPQFPSGISALVAAASHATSI